MRRKISVTCFSLAGVKLVQQLHIHDAEVIHGPKDDELRGESCQAYKPPPTTIGKGNNCFGFFVHRFLLAAGHYLRRVFCSIAGILLGLQLVWMFSWGFGFWGTGSALFHRAVYFWEMLPWPNVGIECQNCKPNDFCCGLMGSLFREVTSVYQADISWRWLVNNTCLLLGCLL